VTARSAPATWEDALSLTGGRIVDPPDREIVHHRSETASLDGLASLWSEKRRHDEKASTERGA
jgi:hypothetical protein